MMRHFNVASRSRPHIILIQMFLIKHLILYLFSIHTQFFLSMSEYRRSSSKDHDHTKEEYIHKKYVPLQKV